MEKKDRIHHEAPLSNKEHDDEENFDYDHEAFLGQDEAKTFDQLTPEESKERLGHITDPRFSRPLLMVGDIVLDLYQQVIPQSPVFERLLQRLLELLGRETELQQELLQVLGILDTLFASLTIRKEVTTLTAPPVAQGSQLQAA